MARLARLIVELEANAAKFQRDMDRSLQKLGSFESSVRSIGRTVLGAAGFGSMTVALRSVVGAVQEAEQSSHKLDAVLKATGFSAGLTRKQMDDLAESMARSTLFDDEQVRNASAVFATFRNIQGDTFREGIKLAADMSTVMGQDLQSSVVQLGKALNNPVEGISALTRVGVAFTETQKQMIEQFVALGDIAGAQRIILQELAVEFGGAAAGANQGLTGAIRSATKAWDEFLEALGRGDGPLGRAMTSVARLAQETIEGWAALVIPPDQATDLRLKNERARHGLGLGQFGIKGTMQELGIGDLFAAGSMASDVERNRQALRDYIAANEAVIRAIERRASAEEAAASSAAAAGARAVRVGDMGAEMAARTNTVWRLRFADTLRGGRFAPPRFGGDPTSPFAFPETGIGFPSFQPPRFGSSFTPSGLGIEGILDLQDKMFAGEGAIRRSKFTGGDAALAGLAALQGAVSGGGAGALASGALSLGGLAIGAQFGAAGGPIGAAIGGLLGTVIGSLFRKDKPMPVAVQNWDEGDRIRRRVERVSITVVSNLPWGQIQQTFEQDAERNSRRGVIYLPRAQPTS